MACMIAPSSYASMKIDEPRKHSMSFHKSRHQTRARNQFRYYSFQNEDAVPVVSEHVKQIARVRCNRFGESDGRNGSRASVRGSRKLTPRRFTLRATAGSSRAVVAASHAQWLLWPTNRRRVNVSSSAFSAIGPVQGNVSNTTSCSHWPCRAAERQISTPANSRNRPKAEVARVGNQTRSV